MTVELTPGAEANMRELLRTWGWACDDWQIAASASGLLSAAIDNALEVAKQTRATHGSAAVNLIAVTIPEDRVWEEKV